jgi:hypothetical protein
MSPIKTGAPGPSTLNFDRLARRGEKRQHRSQAGETPTRASLHIRLKEELWMYDHSLIDEPHYGTPG